MTQKQMSDLLGCSKTRVYRFIQKNEIVATRSNGTTQYYSEEISNYILSELGAILESERATGKIDRKRAGLSEEYGSADDYVPQSSAKHSPTPNDLGQIGSDRFNVNQNNSVQYIANQSVSGQIAAEQIVPGRNASYQSGSVQNDAYQNANHAVLNASDYSKANQNNSSISYQTTSEQYSAIQSAANQSDAQRSDLNYSRPARSIPIQSDAERINTVQDTSIQDAAEQGKTVQIDSVQSEAEQNMAEIMEHMIQKHGPVCGKSPQSASEHDVSMTVETDDGKQEDGLYHIKTFFGDLKRYQDQEQTSENAVDDTQSDDLTKNESVESERIKADQFTTQQGSAAYRSEPMQSDSNALVAVLQSQMTEFRRIMEMQLVTKDNQIAEKDKQLESLTKALAAAQEQLTETTVALRAAQALHAGTMQEHLIETDAEKQESEYGNEKQSFWSKLFHKKIL